MKLDFQFVIDRAWQAVKERELRPGEYCRFLPEENSVPNEYGCADAANILYSIGKIERCPERRLAAVKALQAMQDPETGLFQEETHHPLHTTAHCLAALELFDAGAFYPVKAVQQYSDPEKFLDALAWESDPWNESHKGAGLFSILALTGMLTLEWQEKYFANLDRNADPENGVSRKNAARSGKAELAAHMAGNFHYFFCYHHARHPFPYPEKAIDSCIRLYQERRLFGNFGEKFTFLEVDWVFTLLRCSRQTPHRFEDVRSNLRDFAVKYHKFLTETNWNNAIGGNDLHAIFGMITAVAELQLALPGEIITEIPLKNVLDRRPFI
jgi:hypothetical protein